MNKGFIRVTLSDDGEHLSRQWIPEGYFLPRIDSVTYLVPAGRGTDIHRMRAYAERCLNNKPVNIQSKPYIESDDDYYKYIGWNPDEENPTC